MKNRFLKVSVILIMILTMTMSNFIFVGNGLISYAANDMATNHQNVEFKAYFKNDAGNEVTTLEKMPNEEEAFLYLRINVKKEGYFNGEITLNNSNFTLKESDSAYVSKIENNTIYLNQMNVGVAEEIKVKIEPIKEESFAIGLLNVTSEITIQGIYRDSTQKDINIKASRELKLAFVENNTSDNVLNEMQLITNRIIEVDGQEKRMLQFSYHMGLKENNYPIQEINANITIPVVDGKQAEIDKVAYLNNMTSFDYQYDGSHIKLALKNEPTPEGKVMWKTQGSENVIITCLYDKEVKVENMEISAQEKVTLCNNKTIETENKTMIGIEELDSTIEVNSKNSEETIYKGKIYSGIDRQYQSTTQLKVNFAKAIQNIEVIENSSKYIVSDAEKEANVIYTQTTIKKEQFDQLFGQNGVITIYNQNGEMIETITNATAIDQDGNIHIDYEGKEVKEIKIQTTAPVEEGILEFNHMKAIKANGEVVKAASELKNKIVANYNSNQAGKEAETAIKLENTTTKATLEINKESLSTVVANNVEIKTALVSNNEKYDLYKNPEITIELPEQVEEITVNSIDLLYENELNIKDYKVNGRTINISLEGEQTQYKEEAVEGATIVMNLTLIVNRKATTKDEVIQMTYSNEKAVMYENGDIGTDSKEIKVVAPTDMTTIYSIKDLGIETLGQEETKQVMIQRGAEERQLEAQIEIINNNENASENVKILGDFPTNHNGNNMGIQILGGITLQGIENAKIYYSENAEATDEVNNSENAWTETIADSNKVSKYLIVIEKLESQTTIQATYSYQIPANLEYNQTAKIGYQVKYTNSNTQVENTLKSTIIEMQTGIGPKVETKLVATMGGKEINNPVKNGEVIQYRIELSNTGTEDITNMKVIGKVPEGTTMVEPEEDYEYTGASYYQELDNQTYETTIESLKVGEAITKKYEVIVNKGVAEGTILSNIAEITYGDVTKQTEEIKNVTAKGDLSVVVKRVTDRTIDLYTGGTVQYFAMIENISNEKQENITVKTNLSEILQVERLQLITGMGEEERKSNNIQSETLEYNEEMNIGALEPGEVKVVSYDMLINKTQSMNNPINFSVAVKNGKEEYQSNNWQDNVKNMEIGIAMTTNTQSQYLKAGDVVEYTIVLENKTNSDTTGLEIKDSIPTQLAIRKITKDGEEVQGIEGNDINIPIRMSGNAAATIKIEAVVNYSEARDKAEAITNIAYAEVYGEKVATTSEINHIIQANEGSVLPGDDGKNDIDNNDIAKGNKTITGVAWYDENANGQKEQGEKLLNNIKVKLLNIQTNNLVKEENGKVLEVTTNENGIYVLDKIGNGKYIVIFEYDNSQYSLTKYKVDGLSEEENSNAVLNELLIENEKKQVASTNILEIKDNNISNINIGFIKLENFDLKLDKYVSKILIQNANGTTVREYDNETMAKVELDSKQINGSTVIIEYKISVTNNGEVEGYVKKIADYATSDLKFSSELNKDWYQVGDTLYTASLANEKILPGETKTVTLTLTKAMTENNTGLIPNTAEIAEDYNELGIADSNSTPGNRANGENDLGLAEVLLSIRTGGMLYITIAIIIVVILGVIAIIMIKKKNKSEKE